MSEVTDVLKPPAARTSAAVGVTQVRDSVGAGVDSNEEKEKKKKTQTPPNNNTTPPVAPLTCETKFIAALKDSQTRFFP